MNVFLYDGADVNRRNRRLTYFRRFYENIHILEETTGTPISNQVEFGAWLRNSGEDGRYLILVHKSQCRSSVIAEAIVNSEKKFAGHFILFYSGDFIDLENVCRDLSTKGLGGVGYLADGIDRTSVGQEERLRMFFGNLCADNASPEQIKKLLLSVRKQKVDLLVASQWYCQQQLSTAGERMPPVNFEVEFWREAINARRIGDQDFDLEWISTGINREPTAARKIFEYLLNPSAPLPMQSDYKAALKEIHDAINHARSR